MRAGRDIASMVENEPLKCTATLPLLYNLGKYRVTDEFFRAFATLILNSYFLVSISHVFVNNFQLMLCTLIGAIILSINIQVGLNMDLCDDIGDASSSL